mmetsp:Transcript_18569/g.37535  ORF Transcript_18569/g.37535 Transcript_18569/m.37535 type:complete len:83 (+) Transcript_18569:406-654(+)
MPLIWMRASRCSSSVHIIVITELTPHITSNNTSHHTTHHTPPSSMSMGTPQALYSKNNKKHKRHPTKTTSNNQPTPTFRVSR